MFSALGSCTTPTDRVAMRTVLATSKKSLSGTAMEHSHLTLSTSVTMRIDPELLAYASVVLFALLIVIAVFRIKALTCTAPTRRLGKTATTAACKRFRVAHIVLIVLTFGAHLVLLALHDGSDDNSQLAADPASATTATNPLRVRLVAESLSWLICFFVVLVEARAHRHSGALLRLWWVLAAVAAAASIPRNAANLQGDDGRPEAASLRLAASSLSVLLGALACFEPSTPQAEGDGSELADVERAAPAAAPPSSSSSSPTAGKQHGADWASFASCLGFFWVSPLLSVGAARALEHTDLFELSAADRVRTHGRRFDAAWATQRPAGDGRPRSFIGGLHRTFGVTFWSMGLMELCRMLLGFANPLLSHALLDYLDTAGTDKQTMPFESAVLCAVGIFFAASAQSLIQVQVTARASPEPNPEP